MKHFILYLIIAVSVFGLSCKKIYQQPIPTLPAETHTGANTLGCYVNGSLWLPEALPSESGLRPLTSTFYSLNLHIDAYHFNEHLGITIENVIDTGRYDLVASGNSGVFRDSAEHDALSGYVRVKYLDLQNFIASGTFVMTTDGATLTEGRFDLRLNR